MLFHQHLNAIPQVNPRHWSLALTGLIDGAIRHPLIVSYDELRSYPAVEQTYAIISAGFDATRTADAPLLTEATWRGVALSQLLAEVELAPDVRHATLYGADGHSANLTLDQLQQAIIAYQVDGASLSPTQGFPARLILPAVYDYKLPKWIERIEFTRADSPKLGFWESRGYHGDGTAELALAFTAPHPQAICTQTISFTGIAFHGKGKIDSLTLQIDESSPIPVTFSQPHLHRLAHWLFEWKAPTAGDFHATIAASSQQITQRASILVRVR